MGCSVFCNTPQSSAFLDSCRTPLMVFCSTSKTFSVWDVKNDATDFILPNLKFTFLVILLIWLDHCIFSSKITPRYLASFLRSSGVPRYLTVLLSSFFRRDLFPKKITSVFLVFTVILLILSHWSTLRSSLSRLEIKLERKPDSLKLQFRKYFYVYHL